MTCAENGKKLELTLDLARCQKPPANQGGNGCRSEDCRRQPPKSATRGSVQVNIRPDSQHPPPSRAVSGAPPDLVQ